MKTVNINLTEVIILNLDGSVFTLPFGHIAKGVGDILYMQSLTIDQEDLARKIHRGDNVEISHDELELIINHVETRTVFAPMITRKILEYLGDKLQTLTSK